jgi:hypothetical protein
MKINFFLILNTVIFLTSCASYKYDESKERRKNNYVTITSDNLQDYTINYSSGEKKSEEVYSSSKEINIDKLKKKNLSLTLTNPIYDPINIQLERTVRPIALSKDIALSIFTFGIPVIIDMFNPDFYMLKKSSRNINAHFEYKQSYMKEEYDKISKSKNPEDFQNWIKNYPKSAIKQQVVDHKDSLELSIALSKETESAIDDYISSHQQSNYLKEAQSIKNEMVAAREMFESAKSSNTVASYEAFLAKYPRSLHNTEAHKKLILAAEKVALSSGLILSMRDYINKYLDVQKSYLNSKELDEKKIAISKAIDVQLVKDNIKKDPKKVYQEYSNLWKAFNQLKNEVPQDYLPDLQSTLSYQSKICDLIFTQLKDANTSDKQKILIDKITVDFPQLDLYEQNKNVLITVLENLNSSSGSVKLFNIGYIPHYFNFMSERDALIGRNFYQYKGNDYEALQNITYEEVTLANGQLNSVIKCFQNNNLDFSLNLSNGDPKEISYHQNGKLVKTLYFLPNYKTYNYEFENGVNLTLDYANQKIGELTTIEKNINVHIKNNDFPSIATTLESMKKVVEESGSFLANNPIPKDKLETPALKKVNTITSLADAAIKKEQAKRKAEDEAFVKQLIAYSLQNGSSNSNSSSSNSSYSSSSSSSAGSCSSCKGTGSCRKCTNDVKKPYLDDRCSVRDNKEVKYGYVLCSTCYGYGYKKALSSKCDCPGGIGSCPGETCYYCKGSGWMKCDVCHKNSDGKLGKCTDCKGTGKRN